MRGIPGGGGKQQEARENETIIGRLEPFLHRTRMSRESCFSAASFTRCRMILNQIVTCKDKLNPRHVLCSLRLA
jgi:hypothetical protein